MKERKSKMRKKDDKICESCGSYDESTKWRTSPYAVELYNNYTLYYMCETCECRCAEDI